MVNKVILLGNVGKDPELRSTPSGQPVATFSVATSRRWKDRDGNRQEQTEWHSIVVWGKQAEIAEKYVRKGRQIHVEGRLQTRSWDDKQSGEKKYKTEIVCESFQLLGGNPNRDGGDEDHGYGGGGGGRYDDRDRGSDRRGYGGGGGRDPEPEDDDIPF